MGYSFSSCIAWHEASQCIILNRPSAFVSDLREEPIQEHSTWFRLKDRLVGSAFFYCFLPEPSSGTGQLRVIFFNALLPRDLDRI